MPVGRGVVFPVGRHDEEPGLDFGGEDVGWES